MAFIDELTVFIKAGDGGDGVVRFRHEKGKEFGGPSGGNGGRGGDVYIEGVLDTGLLSKYKHKKEFVAENGESGRKNSEHGRNGSDLVIPLPVGSVLVNKETGERFSLDYRGQRILILKGGRGGRGNESFKSSTNRRPRQYTPGQKGQMAEFDIELELIASAGFIGLPNAGKSSLLNALTGTHTKTAQYPFTTLEPNVGVLYGYILADIPGLIEGASFGKGLGFMFLRHIKRTKILLHTISLENENIEEAYRLVRKELAEYDMALTEKPEVIILTKKDLVSDKKVIDAKKVLGKYSPTILTVSIYDTSSIKKLSDDLVKTVRANEKEVTQVC